MISGSSNFASQILYFAEPVDSRPRDAVVLAQLVMHVVHERICFHAYAESLFGSNPVMVRSMFAF